MSNGDTDELTARIDRLEHELAKLQSERETALTGWPNEPTIAQGFMSGRWQRRDGSGYTQAIENIPEAPADNNYYGRYNYTWQPVVEEAPALTARRSVTGWARASAGSTIPWISMDDVLVNYVPEVPVGQGMYARSRSGGTTGWTDLAGVFAPAGNYLDRSGGQMTGALISAPGTGLTNPGLAVGDNATGFWRSGTTLVLSVSGSFIQQYLPDMVQMNVPIMMAGQKITSLADATAAQDALNLRTADARYTPVGGGGDFLPISGGTLTGTLIAKPGTGINDLGIGVGDNQSGFYRNGGSLIAMALGFPLLVLDGNARSVLFTGPLLMGGNPITNLGIPVLPGDAATKNYVDVAIAQARSPTVVYDLPADVAFPGDGSWQLLAQVPFILTRTGLSRIQVTLNCNLSGVNNVASIGARFIEDSVERSVFGFGVTPGGDSVGFTCNLYHDSAAGLINIPIELTSLPLTGAPTTFTVLGGSGPRRSQIVITDLGPAPA
jgi:hypothetical protein